MHIIDCQYALHGEAILAIFNDAIANTTALYEYAPRDHARIQQWFAAKQAGNFPVIGALDEHGQLMGFASYGPFRGYPANKYSVEHSVYVDQQFRGRGVAKALMQALLQLAQQQQLHVMVGAIDAANGASIGLHETLGFSHSGTLPQVAFKFGRWLDLAFYQKLLPTPNAPCDDEQLTP
ncbi:GNAT family N-acetyltransferase [Shewanella sp. C32]|uniref:GNAT family N-acetyltransferase n=1 Tax=Shewanella electrica TaxID=515560 RepID=A0ABT2FI45_9GAMM|nr:GNAT family N-acetyltransferase [Shewanella electrica]MCH1924094.1 GNAT family N-acetyltransferase [Shewanella electrica]MCS4555997.1 GNAT family N-acetyltransferase [Shewanella electrica]